jgi:hypothetical protein
MMYAEIMWKEKKGKGKRKKEKHLVLICGGGAASGS